MVERQTEQIATDHLGLEVLDSKLTPEHLSLGVSDSNLISQILQSVSQFHKPYNSVSSVSQLFKQFLGWATQFLGWAS